MKLKNPIPKAAGKFKGLKKKQKIIIGGLLFVLIVGGVTGAYLHKKSLQASTQKTYLTATVKKGNIATTVSETGTVQASKTSEVKSTIDGTIDTLYVKEGDTVQAGDVLGTLKTDSTNTDAEVAALDYEAALDDYNNLKKDQQSLNVYAPASGYISLNYSTEGESINSNAIFAQITEKNKLEIKAQFASSAAKKISVGDKASILLTGYYTTVNGVVTKVGTTDKSYSEGSLTREITIQFNNPGALTTDDSGLATVTNSKGSFTSVEDAAIEQEISSKIQMSTTAILDKLLVSDGDYVKKGTLIATFTSSDLSDELKTKAITLEQKRIQFENKSGGTILKAAVSGTVVSVNYSSGDTVTNNDTVITICDLSNLDVVVPVDELDINKIKVGQTATITSDSFEGQTFKATVKKVSMVGTTSNDVTTFDVYLSLQGNAAFKPNMTVTATIAIESRQNTLLLPVEAVQQNGNSYFVLMNSDGSKQNIKVGLVSDTYMEVTSGLKAGDVVKYSANLGSSGSNNQQGGMMIPGAGGPPSGGGPNSGRSGHSSSSKSSSSKSSGN